MKFLANLKRGSAVDRLWRGQRRLSGKVSGITFKLDGNFDAGIYRAGELASAEVSALKDHESVQLEMISAPAGAAAPAKQQVDETPAEVDEPAPEVDDDAPAQRRRGRPKTQD